MAPSSTNLEALQPADRILFEQFGKGPKEDNAYPTIHTTFEVIAHLSPDNIAVEHDGLLLTYGELDNAANYLARLLLSNGLRSRQRVPIIVQRSFHMVISILAVLKCGCAYIPLDGGVVSNETLSHIFKDTNPKHILCLERYAAKIREYAGPEPSILDLDKVLNDMDSREKFTAPAVDVESLDGAYIIYTSGTTGVPKGVDVTHGNVTNLLCRWPGNLGVTFGTKVAQLLNISFDMAAWEILGTLMNGGTLHIRMSNWADIMSKVDTIIATSSILQTIEREQYPNIKTVALAGERVPQCLADEWATTTNLYLGCGPTETTIVNTLYKHSPGRPVTIGRPLPNCNIYILDESENPLPFGQIGLMYAGGRCVSKGYLNLAEVTSKRYKVDKFSNDGSFMFNTGDLGRWNEDGTLEHHGRIDDQVKIKGFRVELDGVASVLELCPNVTKACALVIDGTLWGFYSGADSVDLAILARFLPYYAIPTQLKSVFNIPLTANGKVDKKELISMASRDTDAESLSSSSSSSHASQKSLETSKELTTTPIVLSTSSSQTDLSEKKLILPAKHGFHGGRWLRHIWFSLYRRFFTAVIIGNAIASAIIAVRAQKFQHLNLKDLATATAANLCMAVLMRQDHVVNLLFTIACSVPTSAPMFIRRQCARVYHIGGIHSGCASAAVLWFMLFTAAASYDFIMDSAFLPVNVAVLAISYMLIVLLVSVLVMAHPKIRSKYHDSFERTHRFAGWTSLALFWAQTLLMTNSFRGSQLLGLAVVESPGFWLLLVATLSVIYPWLHLRKVPVRSEVLSSHAIRLHFDYATPIVGTAVRISERPLLEWHAFATITKPNENGFTLIVSNAGDWTKRQIGRAPTKLWVRGVPACGVLRIAPLFKGIVLVATGSGIGPCLPVILAKRIPCRIFWSTPHPHDTFGEEIIKNVRDCDPNAVIHNTRTEGKPDIVQITYRLLMESNAEAVCIISNQKLTQKVVYAMEARGIPAFGAIFDS